MDKMGPREPTVKLLQSAVCVFASGNNLLLDNIFVGGSPWESDVVSITPAYYWSEFEIKLSRADYLNDFKKKHWGMLKHDAYAGKSPIEMRKFGKTKLIPKPKRFWFVTPKGMLDVGDIPGHAGLLEWCDNGLHAYLRVKRQAPNLRNATKLSERWLFELSRKSMAKVWTARRADESNVAT